MVIVFFTLFILVWAFSPPAVRYFAKQPLADFGVSLSESSQIRYNPFVSKLSIRDLQLLDSQKQVVLAIPKASVAVTLYKLLFEQLHIADISVQGGLLVVEQSSNGLTIAGVTLPETEQKTQPESSSEPSPYTASLSAALLQNFTLDLTLQGQAHQIELQKLLVENLIANAEQQILSVVLDTLINQAAFSIASDVALSNNKGDIEVQLNLDKLDVKPWAALADMPQLQLAGLLDVKALAKVALTDQGIEIRADKLQLAANRLDVVFDSWFYQSTKDQFNFEDVQVQLGKDNKLSSLSAQLEASLEGGRVALASPDNALASWQGVNLNPAIHMQDNQPTVTLPELSISEIKFSPKQGQGAQQKEGAMVSLPLFTVKDVNASLQQVLIGDITLDGGEANIALNNQGELANLPDLSAVQGEPEATSAEAAVSDEQAIEPQGEKAPMTLSLSGVTLSKPLRVKLDDQKTGFTKQLTLDSLQLGELDNRRPELETPLTLHIKDDQYLRINAKGKATLFRSQINADLNAKVQELSLPNISPYLANSLGFDMQSGQLDLALAMKIQDNQLDGDANIQTRGLETSGAEDEEGKDVVGSGTAMSLNLALSTLKDSQGNLKLDVPISGDLNDPDFGIGSFVTLILKKAAMSQAKSYLMNTFVPYAAVVSVALVGAEKLLQVRLEPLIFEPQQGRLPSSSKAYVQQLAALLTEKQDLQIKTCAVSTPADLADVTSEKLNKTQRAALLKLADKRQSALKAALVEQGVASSRILFCKPEITNKADAQPRIELKTD